VALGHFDPGDGKAVLFVGKRNFFDLAGEGGWHGIFAF
jgi:hypothetical protein